MPRRGRRVDGERRELTALIPELAGATTLLTDVTAGGGLGATVTARNGKDSRSGTELCWLDTATGRVRMTMPPAEVDGWLSVHPLSPSTLHTAAGS
jgi:hypothetical protein